MKFETFEQDLLERGEFAKSLLDFIVIEHHFVDGSLVVSLSSPYGSGKTTFLRMFQHWLDTQVGAPRVIFLNAWESDYCGDPLFAIVSALVEEFEKSKTPKTDKALSKLKEAAKGIGWMAYSIGGQIVTRKIGLNLVEAGEFANDKLEREKTIPILSGDAYSEFCARKEAMREIKNGIQELVESSKVQVLFLVDELDRCRPGYAISYLETIKHIFDVQGAAFLLAGDRRQFRNAAAVSLGPDLEFDEYFRKFVHRDVSLPPISETGFHKLSGHYVGRYLKRDGIRGFSSLIRSEQIDLIRDLCARLRLLPRQIQDVFRLVGHTINCIDRDGKECISTVNWCYTAAIIFLAAFKVGKPIVFESLGDGSFDCGTARNLLQDEMRLEKWFWWYQILLSGGGLKLENEDTDEALLKRLEIYDPDIFIQFLQGWRSRRGIHDLYQKIETASRFDSTRYVLRHA